MQYLVDKDIRVANRDEGRDRRVMDEEKGIKKEIAEKNKGTGVREEGRFGRECYEVKQDSAGFLFLNR
jgi:hypothetical protein